MKLKVLGSGSKGNCYILHNDTEAIVIEAGVPFKEALRWNPKAVQKVQGVLVTHEHKDHAGYVKDWMKFGIPCYMTIGTAIAAKLDDYTLHTFEDDEMHSALYKSFKVGGFMVLPFSTEHDASEPCGFFIHHKEIGNMLFATDTNFIQPRFKGLTNILIECNFIDEMLDRRTDIPDITKERIRSSHMSVYTCCDALLSNDLSKVNNIVLIHLSEGSGDADNFKLRVEAVTKKTVHVANAGLEIDFNRTPF